MSDSDYVYVFKNGTYGYWRAIVDDGAVAIPLALWDKYIAAQCVIDDLTNEIEEYADCG